MIHGKQVFQIFCNNGTVVTNFESKGAQIFSFCNNWCLTMSELRWQKDTSQITIFVQIWTCEFLVFLIKSLGKVIFLTQNIDEILFLLVSFIFSATVIRICLHFRKIEFQKFFRNLIGPTFLLMKFSLFSVFQN